MNIFARTESKTSEPETEYKSFILFGLHSLKYVVRTSLRFAETGKIFAFPGHTC